jgi:hypothetical protein
MRGEGRDIGPVGTLARVVAGVPMIAVPIASYGIEWWELAVLDAFVLLGTVPARLIVAAHDRGAGRTPGVCDAICSAPACALIATFAALAFALSAVTPADGVVVFWVWLGASMLVGAARGYGGCEVLAFANAFTGRRDRIGCVVFTPIDIAEARRRARRTGRLRSAGE